MNNPLLIKNGIPLPNNFNISFPHGTFEVFLTDVIRAEDKNYISSFAIEIQNLTNNSFTVQKINTIITDDHDGMFSFAIGI